MQRRLFIISNRFPITIESSGDDPFVNTSTGGLVSAITGYLNHANDKEKKEDYYFAQTYWIGSPGCNPSVWNNTVRTLPDEGFEYVPVFIHKKVYEPYYNGFSNSCLWPLFHYFPSYAEFNTDDYNKYKQANSDFLEGITKRANPNDVIWIHDYHLLPLANMIRKDIPDVTIGFFLHIPFPSYEIFRIMPKKWQEEIMHGMLGADLIGFHTIDYATHFLKCAQMVLGLENEMHTIRYKSRIVKVDIFPISIDYQKYHEGYDDPNIAIMRKLHKQQFGDKKIIFSADRLDYTKGVHNQLKAYELFLKQHPEYHEKVVFIMVVVPSRDTISRYAERKKIIDEYISHLNSEIGTINWQPVIYQYDNLEFNELMSMYTCCDMALITPLRDGMNLVSKEFVASRKDGKGVLVLSEMTGAIRELTDALPITPTDIVELAEKIHVGLEMSDEEQRKRMTAMQTRLSNYDVTAWADDFLTQLRQVKNKQKEFSFKEFNFEARHTTFDKYNHASKRLLLLDYDGTLIPFSSIPANAKPDDRLLDLLQKLSKDERNDIYVISGRDSQTLDNWLGKLSINIVSEHGAKVRIGNNGNEWHNTINVSNEWKKQIEPIMEKYVRRCANTFLEIKDFSMAWHYRNANREQGRLRAAELYTELSEYTENLGLQIIQGNKVTEVRNKGIDKGAVTKSILKHSEFDFILACGDDRTDEDMFQKLTKLNNAYTIKVGPGASYAKYNLHTPQMVRSLLETLSNM